MLPLKVRQPLVEDKPPLAKSEKRAERSKLRVLSLCSPEEIFLDWALSESPPLEPVAKRPSFSKEHVFLDWDLDETISD
jgi:hypothetical protein